MKNWLKKQITELTAWAGFYIILTGFVNLPFWVDVAVGVAMISIDDDKAASFIKKVAPWLSEKIDQV